MRLPKRLMRGGNRMIIREILRKDRIQRRAQDVLGHLVLEARKR